MARCLLAQYGIPQSSNLHIQCLCHVVNLVVQAILYELGEAEDPEKNNYYAQNRDKLVHFDPSTNPDQAESDNKEFDDDSEEEEEPIEVEDEELKKKSNKKLSYKGAHCVD